MEERIDQELQLLRERFPGTEYRAEGSWIRVPNYPIPHGWDRQVTEVCVQVPDGYPATPPYGIYVPVGLRFQGVTPDNYTEPAENQPPFDGTWGVLSWTPEDGQWRATTDLHSGSNLLNWVLGFADRFREGK